MAASTGAHVDDLEIEIVIGSYENVLFGYQLVKANEEASLKLSFTDKSHCASIRAVAISPNQLLASGSADETIQLFDLKARQEAGTLIKHSGTVTNLEFYQEYMISSDDSGVFCIWKIQGKSYECMKTLSGHKGAILSTSIHPSGKLLLTVGQDKTLRTWNLVTAKRAYTTNVQSVVDILRWSPKGDKYILCYNRKIDVYLVSKAASAHSISLPGKGHSLSFVNDNTAVIGCEGGFVVFANIDSGVLTHEFKVECNRVKCLSTKPLTDNKQLLALVTNDGLIELHLVDVNGDVIVRNLVAATKTLLRPVCMELVVKCQDDRAEESSSRKHEKCENASSTKNVMKRKPASHKTPEEPRHQKAKVANAAEQVCTSSKKPSKKSTGGEMDKLKRVFSAKKQSRSEEDEDKVKKPMQPVDSVKITKQKFSGKKKQQRAKHHQPTAEGCDDP